MINLTQIVQTWVKSHPTLKYHYKAAVWHEAKKDPNGPNTIKGFIYGTCSNGDHTVADICVETIRWHRTSVQAADPTFFTQLEKYLIMWHDRVREANIVMFRGCCQERLHVCKTGKAFCSC